MVCNGLSSHALESHPVADRQEREAKFGPNLRTASQRRDSRVRERRIEIPSTSCSAAKGEAQVSAPVSGPPLTESVDRVSAGGSSCWGSQETAERPARGQGQSREILSSSYTRRREASACPGVSEVQSARNSVDP